MENQRYIHLNTHLKQKFGERVLKVCIDGGFSCPNRDGKCGKGGCIFCDENGSGKNKKNIPIENQIENHLNSYRGQRANKFIAYFQNFTNTYDNAENLKKKYDLALKNPKIVGLSVATRPDCINEEVARLLASYQKTHYVSVELGLQTSNDETAKIINRGYLKEVFTNAAHILNKFNIDIIVHIMVGLPYETSKDVLNTVKFINQHKISGVKIHSTYVTKNTVLHQMLEKGEYKPLELEEYILAVCDIIANLREDIVVHRISGDAPKDRLVAPSWNAHKKPIINGIEKMLKNKNIFQGMSYINSQKN